MLLQALPWNAGASLVFDSMQMLEDEGDVYSRLARSIAPEIWGHEDVKKVATDVERALAHSSGVDAAGWLACHIFFCLKRLANV
jgi:hypothetical protein